MYTQKEQIERIVMQGRKLHKAITFNTQYGKSYEVDMRPYWTCYKKLVLRLIKQGSVGTAQDLIDRFDITVCRYGHETQSKVYGLQQHLAASGAITHLR